MKMEIRTTNQINLTSDGNDLSVAGYVNKPGQLSEVLGVTKKFREKIAPGAFKRAIENRNKDIDFLGEHDAKQLLASTRNDSLTLREDPNGLYMEAKITPTSFGQDFYTLISSGLISSMSFGFRSIKDSWDYVEGMAIRTIEELELFEVSAVKNPAYSQSTIAARGIDLVQEVEVPQQLSDDNSEYYKNIEEERGNDMIKMTTEKELREGKAEQRGYDEFSRIIREGKEIRRVNMTTDGGSLIPTNVANEIVLKMVEISPVFAKARKFPTMAGSLKVNKENDSVVAGFVGEAENLQEQVINFVPVELKQKRVGAAISLTNQFINDAGIDIGAYAKDLLARRTVKAVEKSMLIGAGGNEFNGIINDVDVKPTAFAGTLETLEIDDLLDMYNSIHPDFLTTSGFIFNRTFFNKVSKMKDQMGHFYLQNGIVNGKLTYTLFGLEVSVTDVLPDTTPALFGNIEEAVSMLIKKDMGLIEVATDTTQALRGSRLFVLDAFMDSAVTNPQAIVKLNVSAS
ncbi:phage major capsid protein [Priestia sp. TRN 1309]|uniref:phage major capsid protein n=1 Tax=Priestia sp. TRN 1309 TaxID=3420729 RepID=UPI003D783277